MTGDPRLAFLFFIAGVEGGPNRIYYFNLTYRQEGSVTSLSDYAGDYLLKVLPH